jgi:hypothetical protein
MEIRHLKTRQYNTVEPVLSYFMQVDTVLLN